jgi:hypothetical protein
VTRLGLHLTLCGDMASIGTLGVSSCLSGRHGDNVIGGVIVGLLGGGCDDAR